MPFTDLPNEILFQVMDLMDNKNDMKALVETSRTMYQRLVRHLYRYDIHQHQQDCRLDDWTDDCCNVPKVSARILFDNQDRLDADAALYIVPDGNVDGNALYFTIRWNHVRTAELLIQNGSAVKSRKPSDCERNGLPLDHGPPRYLGYYSINIERELDGCCGINIEREFDDWLTPLQTAVRYGREPIVRLLIEHGADFQKAVDHERYNGATPLHMASWLGDVPTVKLLLEWGANTKAQASRGDSPLFWAAAERQRFPNIRPRNLDAKWKIIELLLAYGADPGARNHDRYRFNSMYNTRHANIYGDGWDWESSESHVYSSVFIGRFHWGDRLQEVLQHVAAERFSQDPY